MQLIRDGRVKKSVTASDLPIDPSPDEVYQADVTSRPGAPAKAAQAPRRDLVAAFARFGPNWVRFIRSQAGNDRFSPQRIHLLAHLRTHHKPPIMRQLCDDLGTTPRAVTALVDGLESEGLVRRVAHASDRRATVVELTEAGRQSLDGRWTDHMDGAAELFDDLTQAEQDQLLGILDKLTAGLIRREREK